MDRAKHPMSRRTFAELKAKADAMPWEVRSPVEHRIDPRLVAKTAKHPFIRYPNRPGNVTENVWSFEDGMDAVNFAAEYELKAHCRNQED